MCLIWFIIKKKKKKREIYNRTGTNNEEGILAHVLHIYSNLVRTYYNDVCYCDHVMTNNAYVMAKYLAFGPVHDQYLGPESRSKEVLVSVLTLACLTVVDPGGGGGGGGGGGRGVP